MKVLLVGGWGDGNKRWAEKAQQRFGVEVVGFWGEGENKSKSPGKVPGGDFEAFFMLTDICSHQYTDIARNYAEKHGLARYNVNTSITISDGLLRKQGFPFPYKSAAAQASDENVPRRGTARKNKWADSALTDMYRMRKQGVSWKNIGLAMGSTGSRVEAACAKARKRTPELFAAIDAELLQPKVEQPNRRKVEGIILASDDVAEWVGLAEQYERERNEARARVKQLNKANAELQTKIDGLEVRLEIIQDVMPAVEPPPVNGFDRDAFAHGIKAALRATGGDTTMQAVLDLAGFAMVDA